MIRSTLLSVLLGVILVSCSDPVVKGEVDCLVTDLAIEVTKVVYTDCGLSNGEIIVTAVGGTSPYNFSLDNGSLQASPVFTNVNPGFRDISVIDANGCTKSVKTFMSSKDPFQVVTYTTPSGCGDNKGTITVIPLGGVSPYKYQLGENNDNYQETNVWENLRSGQHSIWVEDENRCFFGVYVFVPTGVSFSQSIAPIIDTKCAIPSCHNGTQEPDFRSLSAIRANATKIRVAVTDRSMPPDETLTTEEINLINCWVNDGAPNN